MLQVRDSYMCPSLLQLIGLQEALNTATSEVTQVHNGMESLQSVEEGWFVRRRERELVRMRVAILRNQLIEKEREETEGGCSFCFGCVCAHTYTCMCVCCSCVLERAYVVG